MNSEVKKPISLPSVVTGILVSAIIIGGAAGLFFPSKADASVPPVAVTTTAAAVVALKPVEDVPAKTTETATPVVEVVVIAKTCSMDAKGDIDWSLGLLLKAAKGYGCVVTIDPAPLT